ncbi:hypothetical protein Rsub_13337 [Raphidocelis subcapitata]|uniref:RXYLT1 C-terminal domain-containing protein n=1 Tax=Raphidocelis subcapitata TaxID=307507 RepID=A0A2V0PLI1_9CHLO|nr:hypothetical protein Rsub_13337 [Raphidocelis subcapitata]|eukprot:GBG00400.1 hypothetical protein Rsub_13337 [Raphidocelis subcapitata]
MFEPRARRRGLARLNAEHGSSRLLLACVAFLIAVLGLRSVFLRAPRAAIQAAPSSAAPPPAQRSLPYTERLRVEAAAHFERSLPLKDAAQLGNRPPSTPFVSGDTLRAMATWVLDETSALIDTLNPGAVAAGDVVFLKTDYLDRFFVRLHPAITTPYILITHNSDYPAPGAHRARLDDPQLAVWFAQNCECDQPHPKLRAVPIGLENRHWKSEDDFAHLLRRARQPKPLEQRARRVYVNVGATNKERAPLVEVLAKRPFASVVRERRSFQQYLDDLADSQFVASPFGNGIDCHRTWEALAVGAVPIVEHSSISPLFEGHPVLQVDNLMRLDTAALDGFWARANASGVLRQHLWADYWWDELQAWRARLKP